MVKEEPRPSSALSEGPVIFISSDDSVSTPASSVLTPQPPSPSSPVVTFSSLSEESDCDPNPPASPASPPVSFSVADCELRSPELPTPSCQQMPVASLEPWRTTWNRGVEQSTFSPEPSSSLVGSPAQSSTPLPLATAQVTPQLSPFQSSLEGQGELSATTFHSRFCLSKKRAPASMSSNVLAQETEASILGVWPLDLERSNDGEEEYRTSSFSSQPNHDAQEESTTSSETSHFYGQAKRRFPLMRPRAQQGESEGSS